MKKAMIIIGVVLALIFLGFLGLWLRIDSGVKENIAIAKQKYPGTAEEALIEFLQDSTNSLHDRDHIAIWTLGQIHSQKSLPLLRSLYKDDPEGKTCKGRHHLVICQYGLHKAIIAAESRGWPLHARLNK